MRVESDVTLDDLVEAGLQMTARSRSMRSLYWGDLIGGAIFACVGTGVTLYFLLAAEDGLIRYVLAGGGAVVACAVYPPFSLWVMRRRLRLFYQEYYRDQMRDGGSIRSEVELTPAGVTTREAGTTVTIEWASVASVVETAEAVMILSPRAAVIAKKRGFESAEAEQAFVEEARRLMAEARDPRRGSTAITAERPRGGAERARPEG